MFGFGSVLGCELQQFRCWHVFILSDLIVLRREDSLIFGNFPNHLSMTARRDFVRGIFEGTMQNCHSTRLFLVYSLYNI